MGIMKKIGSFFTGNVKTIAMEEKQPERNLNAPLAKYAMKQPEIKKK
jgi:hypothetical protein|tara:strand:+ start:744 stop:884 length:141 start_codon:yes stop_codon:yes gene_type:complete